MTTPLSQRLRTVFEHAFVPHACTCDDCVVVREAADAIEDLVAALETLTRDTSCWCGLPRAKPCPHCDAVAVLAKYRIPDVPETPNDVSTNGAER